MKRYSVSFPDEVADELEDLAALTNESLAAIILNKVKESLERDEDAYWLKVIEEREKENEGKPYISHEEAWAHLK